MLCSAQGRAVFVLCGLFTRQGHQPCALPPPFYILDLDPGNGGVKKAGKLLGNWLTKISTKKAKTEAIGSTSYSFFKV